MQGLQNLGATCAVNSLIQIICRTHHLRDIILNGEIPTGTLSAELKEILDMMHNGNHSLSPKKFINHLYRHFEGIFRQGEQIDISELWMFLFDRLATELAHDTVMSIPTISLKKDIDIYDNHKMATDQQLINECSISMNRFNNNKTSVWLDTSQGIMLNIICCNKCNAVSYNFEPFISIPLDIPTGNEKPPSVAAMFREYLKKHTGDSCWKCEKCSSNEYTKSLKIWKMPKVLIFIIKRFANIHQKNATPISINKTLTVKKGSVLTAIDEDYIYTCTGMGYHFGGINGGHYCAICKSNENWILYDDLNVNILADDKTNNIFESNRDAYMLVYSLSHTCLNI